MGHYDVLQIMRQLRHEATIKQDIDLVKRRLQKAQEDYLQEIHQRNEENNE